MPSTPGKCPLKSVGDVQAPSGVLKLMNKLKLSLDSENGDSELKFKRTGKNILLAASEDVSGQVFVLYKTGEMIIDVVRINIHHFPAAICSLE